MKRMYTLYTFLSCDWLCSCRMATLSWVFLNCQNKVYLQINIFFCIILKSFYIQVDVSNRQQVFKIKEVTKSSILVFAMFLCNMKSQYFTYEESIANYATGKKTTVIATATSDIFINSNINVSQIESNSIQRSRGFLSHAM